MVKKSFISILIIFSIINVAFIYAAPTPIQINQQDVLNPTGIRPPISDAPGVVNILIIILRWTYTIFFIISAFMVILAAFTYLTAGAEPEKIKSANHKIIYAAIAIAVALLAVSINAIVGSIIGPSGGGGGGGGGTSGQTSPTYDLRSGSGGLNVPPPEIIKTPNLGGTGGSLPNNTFNTDYDLR